MSEIPETATEVRIRMQAAERVLPQDIRKAAQNVIVAHRNTPGAELRQLVVMRDAISEALWAERLRCLTIIQSIETTSAQGMRVIDEIVRKVRGGE